MLPVQIKSEIYRGVLCATRTKNAKLRIEHVSLRFAGKFKSNRPFSRVPVSRKER